MTQTDSKLLRTWREREGNPRSGEGVDYLTCRLCHRAYRSITHSHLVRIHGWRRDNPVGDYKRRFGLVLSKSVETVEAQRFSIGTYFQREGRRWTKAQVREVIGRLARQEAPLNAQAVKAGLPALEFAARVHFGSWSNALRACDIDAAGVRRRRLWTPESVLERVRGMVLRGEPLNAKVMRRRDPGLMDAGIRRFRTWDAVLRAAGVRPQDVRKRRRWDKNAVLKRIRLLARRMEPWAIRRADPALVAAAAYYFDSWRQAIGAAGVTWVRRVAAHKWPASTIVNEISARAKGGRPISRKAVLAELGEGFIEASERAFGSWLKAVEAAGMPPECGLARRPWTRAELVKLLRELRGRHGTITRALLSRVNQPGFMTPVWSIRKVFGSLKAAVAAESKSLSSEDGA